AVWLLRETFVGLLRDSRPGIAAICGPKQSTGRRRGGTFAARAVLPAFAAEIPHGCEHHVGIGRVDCYSRAAGREIWSFENLLPCFAAIGCFVQTAIRRIAPQCAGNRGEDRIAVFWTDRDLRDALGFFQSSTGPRLTAIG